MPICIYPPGAQDFTNNGLGMLAPIECTIKEIAAGKYELEILHPIDDTLRWMQLTNGCIIKAPAPVRENPEYEGPAVGEPTTVTRQVWAVSGTSHGLYIRTGPGSGYKSIGKKRNGDEVIELEDAQDPWKKVCTVNGGQVGYMSTKYLKPVRTITEVIEPAKPIGGSILRLGQSRDQLFRIYSVEQDSEAATVTAKALHVSYDDAANLIDSEYEIEEGKTEDINAVMAALEAKLSAPPAVQYRAINMTAKIKGNFSYKTPVEAYLDPDEGIVNQAKAMCIRDNWNVYLLADMQRDRGVTIRRGKNLVGVEVTNDVSGVVTRIIPVGKNKDGDPVYLSGVKYVDSPHLGDYPYPRIRRIEYDVQTGKNGFETDDAVRAEISRLANEEYTINKIDLPSYGMKVDFILLQNTAEYANYASLQAVHLYDTVTVIDEMLHLWAKVRLTEYERDCITGQYVSVTLGEIHELNQVVYSYNLPDGGISGTKIAPASLSGAALRSATIEYAKITNAAVRQLSANAITALTARIEQIVSGNITTDELYAAYAEMLAMKVGSITAADIEADRLAAALADFVSLHAATGSFDFATIENLLANALILKQGVAESIQISNLAVTSANMLSAVLGELILKGEDGRYYQVTVGSDGIVRTDDVTLTDGEIAAGESLEGQQIISTSANIEDLNAQNIRAAGAIISTIFTDALTAGKITAAEAMIASATIPALYTTAVRAIGDNIDLSANDTIRLLLGANDEMQRWFTFSDSQGLIIRKPAWVDAEGNEHPASIWSTVQDETGYHIRRSDVAGYVGSFAREGLETGSVRLGGMIMRKDAAGGIVFIAEEE